MTRKSELIEKDFKRLALVLRVNFGYKLEELIDIIKETLK